MQAEIWQCDSVLRGEVYLSEVMACKVIKVKELVERMKELQIYYSSMKNV